MRDFGVHRLDPGNDYPDSVIPLARALAQCEVERGTAIYGSGVAASLAANKVTGVRSALIPESFSAHQGVRDEDTNLLCLGGRVVGCGPAREIIQTYLAAHCARAERSERRLAKADAIECKE